eukprot:TRINITY_DN66390_c0_g1_i1.p1 TRINITY_DN66390_c0_g1~~TRINITY_DN66390_c0_g1_i1.p1  ORF type:complete len:233 (+),score=18.61 TRINITY_DN66390_c0_g1_i1:72-701(+)
MFQVFSSRRSKSKSSSARNLEEVDARPPKPADVVCSLRKWRQLTPLLTKVRIVVARGANARICSEFGDFWPNDFSISSSDEYTIFENLPPRRYAIYGPVRRKTGTRCGMMSVPFNAVVLVDDEALVLTVSRVECDLDGAVSLSCSNLAGDEVALIALRGEPPTRDVTWLMRSIMAVLNEPGLNLTLVAGGRKLGDRELISDVLRKAETA